MWRTPWELGARARHRASRNRPRQAGGSCPRRSRRRGRAQRRATRPASPTIFGGRPGAPRPAGRSFDRPRPRLLGSVPPDPVETSQSSRRRTLAVALIERSVAPATQSDADPPGEPLGQKWTRACRNCSGVLQSKPMPLSDAAGPTGTPETPPTLLGSLREFDDGDLPRLYDYPERDGTWLRANFIASADGGATADGSSGAMGGPGDRQIFNLLRELADVIVVGAGTVRIENYSGAHLGVAERQGRQAREQSEVPRLAIVTKSGRLDRDMAVFTRTELPPLVLTCTAAADETRRLLADLCEVVDCSGGDPGKVDEAVLLEALGARGMRRILTERSEE